MLCGIDVWIVLVLPVCVERGRWAQTPEHLCEQGCEQRCEQGCDTTDAQTKLKLQRQCLYMLAAGRGTCSCAYSCSCACSCAWSFCVYAGSCACSLEITHLRPCLLLPQLLRPLLQASASPVSASMASGGDRRSGLLVNRCEVMQVCSCTPACIQHRHRCCIAVT